MKLRFEFNPKSHWGREARDSISHGPQAWPWWRVFGLNLVALGVTENSAVPWGWRLWVYTRWGALYGGLYFLKVAS